MIRQHFYIFIADISELVEMVLLQLKFTFIILCIHRVLAVVDTTGVHFSKI